MDVTAKTPATNHLFSVNEEADKLPHDKGEFFHHMAAKLLYLRRGIPQDIQTAVALCTKVKGPDKYDYKKMARVIQYFRGTQGIT
jgi:hypothetical protein